MKKFNLPLIAGIAIIILITIVMLFPGKLAGTNPYSLTNIKSQVQKDGSLKVEGAPFSPSKEYPLGSDNMGRDILSLVIYGTRLTIGLSLLIVAARFLVALPLGIWAGFGNSFCKNMITQFNIVFSAVPALLISAIILKINYFTTLFKRESIIAFVIVLTFVGWGKLGLIIMERVKSLLSQPFIKGEVAVGKSKFRIALENVIPHLSAELVILFFIEIGIALTILMQLGIFGVFVGNLRIVQSSDGGEIQPVNTSFEPEWASMLSTGMNSLRTAPWAVLPPAAAFLLSILGFNLFGEGLRSRLQKKDSKFPVYFRRAFSFEKGRFSFLSFKESMKSVKSRIVLGLSLVLIIVIGANAMFAKGIDFKSLDGGSAFSYSPKNRVVIGSSEDKETANDIADMFKKLGYKPLDGNGYITEYKTKDIYTTLSCSVTLKGSEDIQLKYGKDFSVMGFGNFISSGKVYNATLMDLFSTKDYSIFENKYVLIDSKFYSDEAVEFFSKEIIDKSKALGVFVVTRENEELPKSIGGELFSKPVFFITRDAAEELVKGDYAVNTELASVKLESTGRNIIGMLPGKNSKIGDQAIIIGLSYNYGYEDEKLGKERMLFSSELVKRLADPSVKRDRTIIVVFFDGTMKDDYSGVRDYSKNVPYPRDKSQLYIDLTKLDGIKSDKLYFSSKFTPISRYFAWSFSHELNENLKKAGIETVKYDKLRDIDVIGNSGTNADETMYYDASIPTVIASMKDDGGKNENAFTLDDLGRVVIETVEKIKY